mmetsp:Transcript_17775/g.30867  ORF Transcript_17775/g.30867 Transcript_17775/m.30867 type:complete len:225 (+) Transcript_17775:778-1452(+)
MDQVPEPFGSIAYIGSHLSPHRRQSHWGKDDPYAVLVIWIQEYLRHAASCFLVRSMRPAEQGCGRPGWNSKQNIQYFLRGRLQQSSCPCPAGSVLLVSPKSYHTVWYPLEILANPQSYHLSQPIAPLISNLLTRQSQISLSWSTINRIPDSKRNLTWQYHLASDRADNTPNPATPSRRRHILQALEACLLERILETTTLLDQFFLPCLVGKSPVSHSPCLHTLS